MINEQPTWGQGIEKPVFPKLSQNQIADVAIVGGGLAGILAAYLLAKAGKKVVVLEKDKIGSGATSYTTAFLTQVIDTDFSELIRMFGTEKALLVWQSGGVAIDLIEKIITEEKIDCEFSRCSVVAYANNEKELKALSDEQIIETEHSLRVGPIKMDKNLNFVNSGYYEIPEQAKFHPLKFLYALALRASQAGVTIYEDTEVKDIHHQESLVQVETEHYQVEALEVVVATYQPFHNRTRLFLQRGMYKSYVMEAKIAKGLIPAGLYLDAANPYHYFRIDEYQDESRMIIGGEDIKTIVKMDDGKNFAALEKYLKKILPREKYTFSRRWTGQVLEPSDGLALIGEIRENEYVATAFSGNGMTYSAISAMIITDQILGDENIYTEVYDPKRIATIKQLFIKGEDYVGEFLGGAAKNIFKKPEVSGV